MFWQLFAFRTTFFVSDNSFCFEQAFAFSAISSFLDIVAGFSALIGHASMFYNVSVDTFTCKKGAAASP